MAVTRALTVAAPVAHAADGDITPVAGGGFNGAVLHDGYGVAVHGNTLPASR